MAAAMEMSKLALAAEKVFGKFEEASGGLPAAAGGVKPAAAEQVSQVQDPQELHLAAGSRTGGIVCVEV
ncbi:MAG: hypothetical protein WC490_04915 [Candidatus Margulisiibacteriota bacterium]